jgi:hypothetical protein
MSEARGLPRFSVRNDPNWIQPDQNTFLTVSQKNEILKKLRTIGAKSKMTVLIPRADFDYEDGFASEDGAVSLFYCDDSLRQIDNINNVVSEFEHDYLSDGLFYRDFLNFLVNNDSAPIFEVSDDFASYIYCLPSVLADDAAWTQWLEAFAGQYNND